MRAYVRAFVCVCLCAELEYIIVTRCCITCVGRYLELLHFSYIIIYVLFSFSAIDDFENATCNKQTKIIYHKVKYVKIMKN